MRSIIYTGAFRFPEGDAASIRVLSNAKILRDLGYNVIFISLGGESRIIDLCDNGYYYYQGFRYINTNEIRRTKLTLVKRLLNFMFMGRKSLKVIEKCISETEIVIGYNPTLYLTKKLMKLCKKHSVKFISDITEWYSTNEFPGGKYLPPSWMNEFNMRYLQKKVLNKIVISSFLDNYYVNSNNLVLPPLVDKEENKWGEYLSVIPDKCLEYKAIRIIYAGTPAKKDLLFTMFTAIIQMVKEGYAIQFIVLGVSEKDIENYTNFQDILFMSENFVFLGVIPQYEVPAFYKIADFSLIVRERSRKSMAGFPTKFVESFLMGVPVISNNTSDISSFLINDKTGVLLYNDSLDAILEGLRKIFTYSTEELLKIKKNTYESAFANFHYSNYLVEFKDFIDRAV